MITLRAALLYEMLRDHTFWKQYPLGKPRCDLGIPELVAGIFGTKSWMAELGRKGGQATSSAKSAAARKNGKKGGRPRKDSSLSSKG